MDEKIKWIDELGDRELAQVNMAVEYAANHAKSGVPGHSLFLLIARMAKMLDDGDLLAGHLRDVYEDRNLLALLVGRIAMRSGYNAGLASDPEDPDWPIVMLDLHTGQVSWHVPAAMVQGLWPKYIRRWGLMTLADWMHAERHENGWDGHTTEEKRERIRKFLE